MSDSGPSTPRVSVVMAARNEEHVIAQAIHSIRDQTLADWELIVVDDGSTDATVATVKARGDPRIRVVRLSQTGLPGALNAGVAVAAAPLVARQDADDYSLPQRLERQLAFLERRPEVAVVGSLWGEVDPAGRRLRPRASVVSGRLNETLRRFNAITHTTVVFRRDAFDAVGGYDERFGYAADYDLWLRIAYAGGVLWNLEEELAVRVMSGTNMSARRERAQIVEELAIRWEDLRRRPQPVQVRQLLLRSAMLFVPLPLRRAIRLAQGKAP